MIQLISAVICVISGLTFVVSCMCPRTAQVGDTFVHANPGVGDDTTKPPHPFALIYTVVEIKGGKAHVKGKYIHLDDPALESDEWKSAYNLGEHDKLLYRP